MIYEGWIGVINKRGELMSVTDSPHMAQADAASLEIEPKHPTNRLIPVTVIGMNLVDLVIQIVDAAKLHMTQQAAEELAHKISENQKNFEEMKASGLWTGKVET